MTLWTPPRFTPPLPGNEDLAHSGGHWLIKFVEKYVRLETGERVTLAGYEKSILLRALETYPSDWHDESKRGKLRYRTFLLSVARRNHKTSLAGYIALYALLRHGRGSLVNLVGPQRVHADTAYRYINQAVLQSDPLTKRIKPSKVRGVQLRDQSGSIRILTGDSDKMQGQGFIKGMWILDEIHLMKDEVYSAAVASMRSTVDGMIVALSTAGDVESTLYKSMLDAADKAIAGGDERFGAVVIEGNPDAALDDVDSILAANPAIEAGYFSLETALAEAHDPLVREDDKRRYLHNIQLNHSGSTFVPLENWKACAGKGVTEPKRLVYSIDVTPKSKFGSISMARRNGEVIEANLVGTMLNPDIDRLERCAIRLIRENGRGPFVMDTYLLAPLAARLEKRGYEVIKYRATENLRAAQNVFSYVMNGAVSHNNTPLVQNQLLDSRTKNVRDDGFRIVRGNDEIDALMSLVYAIDAASYYQHRSVGVPFAT